MGTDIVSRRQKSCKESALQVFNFPLPNASTPPRLHIPYSNSFGIHFNRSDITISRNVACYQLHILLFGEFKQQTCYATTDTSFLERHP